MWMEREIDTGYLYVISFHWTMAQFLPAPTPDHPKNYTERLFTILVLLSGFVLFSSTLGSVTALITQTRKAAYTKMKQNHTIRKFFSHNLVSHHVAARVLHFGTNSNQAPGDLMTAKEVPCLQELPISLRADVLYEVHMSCISEYALLDVLDEAWHPAIKEICDCAVSDIVVVKEDLLFQFGIKALGLRFIRAGRVCYYPFANRETEEGGKQITEPRQYLSEASLWTEWVHQGLAKVAESTRIAVIASDAFSQVIHKHPIVLKMCIEYATIFHACLANASLNGDMDDTFRSYENRQDLLTCMAAESSQKDEKGE